MSPLPAGAAWSDAALALFEATGAIAVSAGAGAGKTTALVELLRRLLAGAGPAGALAPREVVAITFTERAGSELLDRLGAELAAGARDRRAAGDEAGAARLAAALRDLPSLAVGTIHGWAAGLLREHAPEAGLDPDFAVLDEEAAGEMLDAASLAAAVAALDVGGAACRRLAVGLGGALELAGAAADLVRARSTRGLAAPPEPVPGSPERFEEARRALLDAAGELGALAERATTPTGLRALGELRARLDAAHDAAPDGAARPEPSDEAARLGGLAGALAGWRAGKRDPPEVGAARERFVERAEALSLVAAELEAAPLAEALAGVVADAEGRYRDAKARASALDFDDLLVRARDLLRDEPATRASLRTRLRALLVDEYQDVNGLQAEIFDQLAPGGDGADGIALRVAVGDAKQSIYRFRGADVGVFAGLIDRLGAGGGRVVHLRENHRSTPGVVGLVNALLGGDAGGLGVPFGEEDLLRASRPPGEGAAAELLVDPEPGAGAARRTREARAVAARIAEMRAAGTPPGHVAVLLRRLTHAGVFERALREAGVPVRVARGGGFHQAPEVRDLGELCALVADPADEVAWAAVLRSPLCGLSDGSLFALARRGLSLLAGVAPEDAGAALEGARLGPAPDGEEERLARFLEAYRDARGARGRLDVGEVLERAVSALDLEAALLAAPDGERRAANVRKALDLARRHAARGTSVAAFAERIRRLSRRPPREPEADPGGGEAVGLLTVHQAKGLEWPVVFVPELSARPPAAARRPLLDEDGRVAVPLLRPGDGGPQETATTARLRANAARAEAAEGRRLLYVALTRARDRLVLSGAEGRAQAGTWAEAVVRAPPELLRRVAPPAWPPAAAPPVRAAAGPSPGPPRLRPAPAGLPVRIAVTRLAEYARCPRRHHLAVEMRVPEPRDDLHGGDDPDRATVRGTLAHALLAEVDLGADPADRRALLQGAVSRRGEDPRRPGVERVVEEVGHFLAGEGGSRLAAAYRAGVLRRELPFVLRLDGEPACYLDGAIDALVADAAGVEVLDFKYAAFHPGAAGRHRFQLAAYALAAARAFPGRPIRATVHFLRGVPRAVDVTPSGDELARLAAAAPGLAAAALRGEGGDSPPEALGRDASRCAAEGCGYVARCFRPPRSIPP